MLKNALPKIGETKERISLRTVRFLQMAENYWCRKIFKSAMISGSSLNTGLTPTVAGAFICLCLI